MRVHARAPCPASFACCDLSCSAAVVFAVAVLALCSLPSCLARMRAAPRFHPTHHPNPGRTAGAVPVLINKRLWAQGPGPCPFTRCLPCCTANAPALHTARLPPVCNSIPVEGGQKMRKGQVQQPHLQKQVTLPRLHIQKKLLCDRRIRGPVLFPSHSPLSARSDSSCLSVVPAAQRVHSGRPSHSRSTAACTAGRKVRSRRGRRSATLHAIIGRDVQVGWCPGGGGVPAA